MADNRIEIKERRSDLLSKGITFLIFAIISLIFTLLPLVSSFAKETPLPFYLIGGLLFVAFISLFSFLIYKEFKPGYALLLDSHAFIDKKNVGEGIEIQWTNVSSVKLLGRRNVSYLGITLENSDIVIAKMKKGAADEMRENIEEGLPSILISQNDVRISVKELKEIFIKYIREARTVENGVPKKPKNNPFSTEDVLRAFGKLPPKEECESPVKSNDEEPQSELGIEDNETYDSTSTIVVECEPVEDESIANKMSDLNTIEPAIIAPDRHAQDSAEQLTIGSFDSFYEILKTKAANENSSEVSILEPDMNGYEAPAEPEEPMEFPSDENEVTEAYEKTIEPVDASEEDIPDEIKEILSRARSSKISELEKMLNDKDTPVSYSKAKSSAVTYSAEEIASNEASFESNTAVDVCPIVEIVPEKVDVISPEDTVENSHIITPNITFNDEDASDEKSEEIDDFQIVLPDDLFESSNKDSVNITLDSLIGLAEKESPVSKARDDMTDTKEFYPELIRIDENAFKSESQNSDEDDDFIIPDLTEYK